MRADPKMDKVAKRRSDRPETETDPNYKRGKVTGYSDKDGYLTLARMHTEIIDQLIDREAAEARTSQTMLLTLQQASVEREAATGAAMRAWWQRVADDLDLDLKDGWEYLPGIGAIRRRENGPRTVSAKKEKP